MAESEVLKSFLMKVKEENKKVGLKLNIQNTKIMKSGPVISWKMDGEAMETVSDFIFLGSKITADGDCSHESKRYLLSWKKSYDQPRQHIKKQRHYFANKGPSRLWFFQCSCMNVRVGLWRRLSAEELMLLNCGCWRRLLMICLLRNLYAGQEATVRTGHGTMDWFQI